LKHERVGSGEWVQPIRKGYKMGCCDCGLVHRMDFRLWKTRRGNFIQFRAYRDNKSTAAVRRHMKPAARQTKE
jgi:hypothetical protein